MPKKAKNKTAAKKSASRKPAQKTAAKKTIRKKSAVKKVLEKKPIKKKTAVKKKALGGKTVSAAASVLFTKHAVEALVDAPPELVQVGRSAVRVAVAFVDLDNGHAKMTVIM